MKTDNKISEMRVSKWKVTKLKPSTFNPAVRTKPARLSKLMESIAEFGQLMPILILEDGRVIDGHRRLKSMIALGFTEIWCRVCSSRNVERLFAEVNNHTEPPTGIDKVAIWVKNPEALGPKNRQILDSYGKIFGKSIMKLLVTREMSATSLRWSLSVAHYLGIDPENKKAIRTIARWIIRFEAQAWVRHYMYDEGSPVILHNAIKGGYWLEKSKNRYTRTQTKTKRKAG